MVRTFRLSLVGVVVVGLVVPSGSWGQAAKGKKGAAAGGVEIEEITVTAQKREENIQEVPVSITAVTGAALTEKGAATVADLNEIVPNLWIARVGQGFSDITFGMRGTGQGDSTLSKNATVGLYIDGVPISKSLGNNFDLEDLDRVEVLRGPQGTLFGRNTTGGAINMITQKPTEERELTLGTEVGNYDAFHGRVTLNMPLIGKNGYFQSDALGTLSLRENAVYKSHDGWYKNQSPTAVQTSGGGELATLNRVLNMTSVRWQPSQDITVDYAFEYHRYRDTPPGWQVTAVDPNSAVGGAAGPAFDLRPYINKNRALDATGANSQLGQRLAEDGNNRMHILTGTWDLGELGPLGNVTLKSISHYRNFSLTQVVDLDGSPLHVFDSGAQMNIETWSQEVQWVGTAPRLHYVVGAFYYGEHTTQKQVLAILGSVNLRDAFLNKNSSYAPFGQATWTPPILNDKLSLTVGVRYGEDHIHSQTIHTCDSIISNVAPPGAPPVYMNICPFNIVGARSFNVSVGRTFGREGPGFPGLSPMANIAYQWTDDLMTYVRVSRGYQSGVAQDNVSDERLFGTTDPERLESYEAGFKSQWLDNRLRFNADGFFSRYKDKVEGVAVFSPTGGLETQNLNGAREEMWGSEAELAAIPLRGLEATLNYSFLTAKYLNFPQQATVNGVPQFDANGKPIFINIASSAKQQYAPEHTVTVGLTYTAPPTSAGVFSAHVDTFWTDSFYNTPTGPWPDKCWAYAVVNGRLQLVDIPLARGSLDLSAFGANLFDRKYRNNGFGLGSLGWTVNSYGDPRTFGLGLTYHFTASS